MSGLLSSIAFSQPWLLAALALLPALWWLLRFTPPRPRTAVFPPLRLLLSIKDKQQTPHASPWWLLLLRLLLAAAIIVAVAGPIWNPVPTSQSTKGVRWVILDNGWDTAADWPRRVSLATTILKQAQDEEAPVVLAATAEGTNQPLSAISAGDALEQLAALAPRSWRSTPAALVSGLDEEAAKLEPAAIYWIASSLDDANETNVATALQGVAPNAQVIVYQADTPLFAFASVENTPDYMALGISRSNSEPNADLQLKAKDIKGRLLGESTAKFAKGEEAATARFELPAELRNDIAVIEVEGEQSAALRVLLDERWQRRKAGIVSGKGSTEVQPLLSASYYLERALAPFADLTHSRQQEVPARINDLLDKGVSVLVLEDIGKLPTESQGQLRSWVNKGGTLIRFAGPSLSSTGDTLVPVQLRQGDRSLGGSLSWKTPQPLSHFSESGPFASLDLPKDIEVRRQVLAEPTADLPERTWASLADGTPLVTAAPLGQGFVVLFHVTADTKWSNLPLSGAFVTMLKAIVDNARAVASWTEGANTAESPNTLLPPLRIMDAYGVMTPPAPFVRPLAEGALATGQPTRENPPGLYGSEGAFRAHNLMAGEGGLTLRTAESFGSAQVLPFPSSEPIDLRGYILLAALALAVLDSIAVLLLSGRLPSLPHRKTSSLSIVAVVIAAATVISLPKAEAQTNQADELALDATLETRLAYVRTGNQEVDDTSRAGLLGLTRILETRSALEPSPPIGLDIERDELAFFSFLYWPISASMSPPSQKAMARIDAFMRNGGTILFDTRDQLNAPSGGAQNSPEKHYLRTLLEGLDIPPLEPVPEDHVLTKAFYILHDFPGRYADSPLWVQVTLPSSAEENRPVRAGDGVTPIIITGNDLAGAWAVGDDGNYMFPTIPPDPMQRELAYRAGVNILMYTMTGNYKADQVHIPALLERLGQ
ncbi:DUF4159 domain-containing protein [Rhodobacteraceae bacterium RKSG542]|uniref:DUF4159 domain-containing protein n=1 Tax=Pseudovibrio flavus TaxID=2529854 RepID=UPI0012BC668F|nr:DUF4159 domain-containing protein [Pseudovibrio flavus]MTI18991.1 DUF4159 domain-containing protein [Pseudovibrio flavus]